VLLQYAWHAKHPEAAFTPSHFEFDVTAPLMARFSGRGPVSSLRQLVLKPDITAPGGAWFFFQWGLGGCCLEEGGCGVSQVVVRCCSRRAHTRTHRTPAV
jgi:hypothetical protein